MSSIFDVKPNVVTRDLSGKSFLFYGERKSGKTTIATKFPKHIILGFEKGWGLIPGAMAKPINNWREALEAKKDLLNDAKAVADGKKEETVFKTVIVDTCDIAYDYCERYVLDREGVEYLDETENKRGYRAVSLEFDKFFQDIVKAGYTLICISHATTKQMKENGEKFDKTIPTVSSRGFLVIARLVDVCGYASLETDDNGKTTPMLTLRGSKFLEAGSRNPHMSARIPFNYESLLEDMNSAIDKLEKESGTGSVTNEANNLFANQGEEEYNFDELMESIRQWAVAFKAVDKLNEYRRISENHLGIGRGVRDCTETQIDMLIMIDSDLADYAKENNIEKSAS